MYCAFLGAVSFLNFLIGVCETLKTIAKDLRIELRSINESIETADPIEFKQKIFAFVDLFGDARQLSGF